MVEVGPSFFEIFKMLNKTEIFRNEYVSTDFYLNVSISEEQIL